MSFNLFCFTGLIEGSCKVTLLGVFIKRVFFRREWSREGYIPVLGGCNVAALCPARRHRQCPPFQPHPHCQQYLFSALAVLSDFSRFPKTRPPLPRAHSLLLHTTHYREHLDAGGRVFHACQARHTALQAKASIMLAFPKDWEGRLLQPLLLFKVVRGF